VPQRTGSRQGEAAPGESPCLAARQEVRHDGEPVLGEAVGDAIRDGRDAGYAKRPG
jgi:hypothetical protein